MVACYYKNLQLLSAKDNIKKFNNLPNNWEELLMEICNDRNINYISIYTHIKSGEIIKCLTI